jgi:hypothetical protein
MTRTRSVSLGCEQLEAREVPALVFAVNQAGKLLTFDTSAPNVYLGTAVIGGLTNASFGERIVEIDVRPGSAGLYGRSNFGQLYLISTFGGFSTAIGTPIPTAAPNADMDFDPVADRIRVVSNGRENYIINPTFGNLESVGLPVTYAPGDAFQGQPPRITGIAYTNSVPLATTTTLFGIDHVRNSLVVFAGDPSFGQVFTVGSLGFDVRAGIGFDIDGPTNVGFAALQVPGLNASLLSTINLATGAASVLGVIGPNNRPVLDIALARGGTIFGGSPFFQAPATSAPVLAPGVSPPFFTAPSSVPTAPLFPALTQPLPPGTFGTTPTTFGTTTPPTTTIIDPFTLQPATSPTF